MLRETKVLVERWRREYNHIRPHSSLGYRPPTPEVIIPMGAQVLGPSQLYLISTLREINLKMVQSMVLVTRVLSFTMMIKR